MSATKRFKDQVQCERSFHGSTVQLLLDSTVPPITKQGPSVPSVAKYSLESVDTSLQARSSGSRRTHPRGQRKWVPLRSVGRSAHYELLEA